MFLVESEKLDMCGDQPHLICLVAIAHHNMAVVHCVEINQCVGCNSSLSHFSAMARPSWLGRAGRNRQRHAIEQVASVAWRTRRQFNTNAP